MTTGFLVVNLLSGWAKFFVCFEYKELIMETRFQPALLQEVIDSFAEKTEREGDPTYFNEFHEVADPIYEKFGLDDREPEFKKLYQTLFAKWGFADILRDGFKEFPDLEIP